MVAAAPLRAVRHCSGATTMMSSYNDPFDDLFALQRALDARLASDWMGASTAAMGSYPPVNIFQQGDDFVVVVELPGVAKGDLRIEAKENAVRIAGKKDVEYHEDASIHRRERIRGVFDRTIAIPIQIDPNGIRAEYRDGVLALFIPRAEREKPRTIKIT
jgi:HSP20 family protein